MAEITGFHAHVYYDEETFERAKELCERARDQLEVTMGRMHRKPVGPHPRWSCQLAFTPDRFGDVVPWLSLNRAGLVIFLHATTGDDYKDHTDHAIWMGGFEPLNLSIFR